MQVGLDVLEPVLQGRCVFGLMALLPETPPGLSLEPVLGARMQIVAARATGWPPTTGPSPPRC